MSRVTKRRYREATMAANNGHAKALSEDQIARLEDMLVPLTKEFKGLQQRAQLVMVAFCSGANVSPDGIGFAFDTGKISQSSRIPEKETDNAKSEARNGQN